MTSWMGKKDSTPPPVQTTYGITTSHAISFTDAYGIVVWRVHLVNAATQEGIAAPAGGIRVNIFYDNPDESAVTSSFVDIPAGESSATVTVNYLRKHQQAWNADLGVYEANTYQIIDGTEVASIPAIPASKPQVSLSHAGWYSNDPNHLPSFVEVYWVVNISTPQPVDVVIPIAYSKDTLSGSITSTITIPAGQSSARIFVKYIRYDTNRTAIATISGTSASPYTLGISTVSAAIPARAIPPVRQFTLHQVSTLTATRQEVVWKVKIVGGPAVIRHQFNISYNDYQGAWRTGGATVTMQEGESEWSGPVISYPRPAKGQTHNTSVRGDINLGGGGSYSLENHLDTRVLGGNPYSITLPLTPMP